MSNSPGRREVAHRLFAAEYDDASLEYAESDEERAPNYVVTPTGARVNRLFLVGVLTSVEQVNEDTVRARIADPTGAFVVYAGQYQPDELAALQSLDAPAFVAVTGKANTFQPDGSDRVLTSVRPESVTEVDAETRDRWVVSAAEHTLGRVATAADALGREERGDELVALLRGEGVEPGLAEGVARAIEHYGTTADYLGELRELALQAVEVVAGERSEADSLDVEPDDSSGRYTPGDLADGAPEAAADLTQIPGPVEDLEIDDLDATGDSADDSTDDSIGATTDESSGAAEPDDAATVEETESATGEATADEPTDATETDAPADDEPAETAVADEAGSGDDVDATADDAAADASAADAAATDDGASSDAAADDGAVDAGAATDDAVSSDAETDGADDSDVDEPSEEDLEDVVDEEERERIEEEYGVGFESGTEVDEPGEAGIEAPAEDAADADAPADAESADVAESDAEGAAADEAEDPDADSGEDASVEADESADAEDVDLDAALMAEMEALDDGDGAEHDALVDAVASETGADEGDVEDAIEDALMSGQCYEPSEGAYKPI